MNSKPKFIDTRSFKLLVHPQVNFESALDDDLDTGAISFHTTYPDAPNPCIDLKDYGVVGLPLGTREAERLRAHSVPLSTGQGRRTSNDTTPGLWKVDGNMV